MRMERSYPGFRAESGDAASMIRVGAERMQGHAGRAWRKGAGFLRGVYACHHRKYSNMPGYVEVVLSGNAFSVRTYT